MNAWTKISGLFVPAILFVGTLSLVFLYFFNPADIANFPRCPFLVLTGFRCPGCGTLRAIHSLLNFEFVAAWNYNPLLIVMLPILPLLFFVRRISRSPRAAVTIAFIFVSYWILRNCF